jgi:hypothetical protein
MSASGSPSAASGIAWGQPLVKLVSSKRMIPSDGVVSGFKFRVCMCAHFVDDVGSIDDVGR